MTKATSPNPALVGRLTAAVGRATPAGGSWLEEQLQTSTASGLAAAFSWVGRKVGGARVDLTVEGLPTPADGWDAVSIARLALLLQFAATHSEAEQHRLVSDLYYRGDTAERCAVLRCLPLLEQPKEYLLIATDGVRSHVQPVVEAIACENPYPALHFDEPAFNQMVMKAYFTEVPVHRIWGLAARLNPELSRMASDFAAERKAAGRPIPADLPSVLAYSPEQAHPPKENS